MLNPLAPVEIYSPAAKARSLPAALGSQPPRCPSRRWATLAGAIPAVVTSTGTREWLLPRTPSCNLGLGELFSACCQPQPLHMLRCWVAVLMLVMLVLLNRLIVGVTSAVVRALRPAGWARGLPAGGGGAGRVCGWGSPARAAGRAASSRRLLGRVRGNLLGKLGEILVSWKAADCAKP